MDKVLVLQGAANKLFAAEKAIDVAIAEAANLTTGLADARDELRLSMVVTDKASRHVMDAMLLLAQARTAMVEAHNEMNEVKLRLGVRTKMIGFFEKGEGPAPSARAELTRVA